MFNSLIGLISATEEESRIILQNLKKIMAEDLRLPAYEGRIGNNNVVHIISGIGKTNASHAATLLTEKFLPRLIINFGIGGAYPSSGLRIGDIAVADKEVYGDEGLWLKDGFHTTDVLGIPFFKKGRKKYFNEFPLDKDIEKKAMKAIPPHLLPKAFGIKGGWRNYQIKIKSGTFVTVSTSTGTNKRAKELEKRFSAICENMEGASVAHVCAMHGVPMLEIRGISNIVENRDKSKWDIKSAAENCQKVILEILKSNHL